MLKLLVFPEARRQPVEAVVRDTLAERGGTDELTLTIVRLDATRGWSVHATGLSDELFERTLSEVIEEALKSAGV
jgi:hypothetical protein